MKLTVQLVALLVALAVIAIVVRNANSENFASKREKAEAIAKWAKRGNLSYADYRNLITGADIVEYSDVKRVLENSPDVNALSKAVGAYK